MMSRKDLHTKFFWIRRDHTGSIAIAQGSIPRVSRQPWLLQMPAILECLAMTQAKIKRLHYLTGKHVLLDTVDILSNERIFKVA